jgi:hypothetical protein
MEARGVVKFHVGTMCFQAGPFFGDDYESLNQFWFSCRTASAFPS